MKVNSEEWLKELKTKEDLVEELMVTEKHYEQDGLQVSEKLRWALLDVCEMRKQETRETGRDDSYAA